tara:strand:- start:25411 stop:26382 length:972 start_codon:yes stop_codon:yes gene_type:complete
MGNFKAVANAQSNTPSFKNNADSVFHECCDLHWEGNPISSGTIESGCDSLFTILGLRYYAGELKMATEKTTKMITAFGLSAALLPTGAIAQDISTGATFPANFQTMWTGFSVGAGGGGNFLTGSPTLGFLDDYFDYQNIAAGDYGSGSVFGTVEAGYDHAFANGVVVGLYGDVSFGSSTENFNFGEEYETDYTYDQAASIKFKEQYSIIGRVGFRVTEKSIFYGLAGYSNQRFEANLQQNSDSDYFDESSASGKSSGSLDILTVGAGVEAFVTDRATVKLEYRYGYSDGATVTAMDDYTETTSTFDTGAIHRQTVRAVMSLKF